MIDKNYLPKELHGVHDYFKEENCCSNYLAKSRLFDNVYKGLVRCGIGDEVFDYINIVIELYWTLSGENKAHKVHALFSGMHGKYEHGKQDIFSAVYYLLRRTEKEALLIEIVESKLEPDLPFGKPTSLDIFKNIVNREENEHEDFLNRRENIYYDRGQWLEDDWYDYIHEFQDIILSDYTFWRPIQNATTNEEQLTNETLDEQYKELEEHDKDNIVSYIFPFIKKEAVEKHQELYELCQESGKPAELVDKMLEFYKEKYLDVYACNIRQAYGILRSIGMKKSESNFYKILKNHKAGHLFQGYLNSSDSNG